MKNSPFHFAIFAAFLLATPAVNAGVTTIGGPSCSEWTHIQNKQHELMMQSWFIGYMSGYAVGKNADILGAANVSTILEFVTDYCKANPSFSASNSADVIYRLYVNARKGR